MHGVVLARMAGIENLGILVVVVRHGVEIAIEAPATGRRREKATDSPIEGGEESAKRVKL